MEHRLDYELDRIDAAYDDGIEDLFLAQPGSWTLNHRATNARPAVCRHCRQEIRKSGGVQASFSGVVKYYHPACLPAVRKEAAWHNGDSDVIPY